MIRLKLTPLFVAIALCVPCSAQGADLPGQQGQGKTKQGKTKQGRPPVVGPGGVQILDQGQTGPGVSADITSTVEPVGTVTADGSVIGSEPGVLQSHSFFTAFVSTVPRRLAPGQSGVMHVVVALTKDTVVQPNAHIDVKMQSKGPWTLGNAELVPAGPAQFAPKFVGKTVYDNTIEFRIPIQVEAGAKHQKYTATGTVELDVTHGTLGTPVGRVAGPASGPVVIGKRIPTPGVRRRPKAASKPGAKTDTPGAAAAASPAKADPAAKSQVARPAAHPADWQADRPGNLEAVGELEGDEAPTPSASASADHLLLGMGFVPVVVGGGMLLGALVLILLLVRRRS